MKGVYIRTSTEDQEPENQIREVETISGGDYVLFQDKQSAWKDDKERPDFEKLRKLISSNAVRDLYVWDWDRLFRNRKRLKEFFQFCAMHKCNIHSFRQKFYESFYQIPAPFDEIMQELFLNLLGWMGEDESNKKSDRVKLAVRRDDGVTKSYKGNKWGRKELNDRVKEDVIRLHLEHNSLRTIAKNVTYFDKNNNAKNISLASVHKIIAEYLKGNAIVK
jgi:DNA invertase Pin-like site-specific DNA recombinase